MNAFGKLPGEGAGGTMTITIEMRNVVNQRLGEAALRDEGGPIDRAAQVLEAEKEAFALRNSCSVIHDSVFTRV
jgi:hypothetical protein